MTTKKGKATVRVIALAVCAVMLIAFGTACTDDALARADEAYQAALKAEQAANQANQAANNAQTSADNALDKAEGAGTAAGSKVSEEDVKNAIVAALTGYVKEAFVNEAISGALEEYAKTADIDSKITAALEAYTTGTVDVKVAEAISKIITEDTIKAWVNAGDADVLAKVEKTLKDYQTVAASKEAHDALMADIAAIEADLEAKYTELKGDLEKVVEDYTAEDAAIRAELAAAIETLKGADAELKAELEAAIVAYAAADAAIKADLEKKVAELQGVDADLAKDIADAVAEYTAADKALQDQLDADKAALEKASTDLKKQIEDAKADYIAKDAALKAELEKADADNKAALEKAIKELKDAYEAKVAALESADASLSEQITKLEADYKKAVADLETKLDAAYKAADAAIIEDIEELAAAYKAADTALETKLAAAYKAADDAIKADIKKIADDYVSKKTFEDTIAGLSAKYADLEKFNEAVTKLDAIRAEIDKLDETFATDAELDAAIKDLAKVYATIGSVDDKINVAKKALEDAYKAADIAVKKDIEAVTDALEDRIEALEALLNGGEGSDGLTTELNNLKNQINALDALLNGDANVEGSVAKKIAAAVAVLKNADKDLADAIDDLDDRLTKVENTLAGIKAEINKDFEDKFDAATNGTPENGDKPAQEGAIAIYLKLEALKDDLFDYFNVNANYYYDAAERDAAVEELYYTTVVKVLRALDIDDVTAAWTEFKEEEAKLKGATIQNQLNGRFETLLAYANANGIVLNTEKGENGEYKTIEFEDKLAELIGEMEAFLASGETVDYFYCESAGRNVYNDASDLQAIVNSLRVARDYAANALNPSFAQIVYCPVEGGCEDCADTDPWRVHYSTLNVISGTLLPRLDMAYTNIETYEEVYADAFGAFNGKNAVNKDNFLVGEELLDDAQAYVDEVMDLIEDQYNAITDLVKNPANDGYLSHISDDDAQYVQDIIDALAELKEWDDKYLFVDLISSDPASAMSDFAQKREELKGVVAYYDAVAEFVTYYEENVKGAIEALVATKNAYEYDHVGDGVGLRDTAVAAILDWKDNVPALIAANLEDHYEEIVGAALLADMEAIDKRQNELYGALQAAHLINLGGIYQIHCYDRVESAEDVVLGKTYYLYDSETNTYGEITDTSKIALMIELGLEVYTDGLEDLFNLNKGIDAFQITADVTYRDIADLGKIVEARAAWAEYFNIVTDKNAENYVEKNYYFVDNDTLDEAVKAANDHIDEIISSSEDMMAAIEALEKIDALDETTGEKLYAYISAAEALTEYLNWLDANGLTESDTFAITEELDEMKFDDAIAYLKATHSVYSLVYDNAKSDFEDGTFALFSEKYYANGYAVSVNDTWILDAKDDVDAWVEKYLNTDKTFELENVDIDSLTLVTEELYTDICAAYKAYEDLVVAALEDIAEANVEITKFNEHSKNILSYTVVEGIFDSTDALIDAIDTAYGEITAASDSRVWNAYSRLATARAAAEEKYDTLLNEAETDFNAIRSYLDNDIAVNVYSDRDGAELYVAREAYNAWAKKYLKGEYRYMSVVYGTETYGNFIDDAKALVEKIEGLEADFADLIEEANADGIANFVELAVVLRGDITADSKDAVEDAEDLFNAWASEYGVNVNDWYTDIDWQIEDYYERLVEALAAIASIEEATVAASDAINAIPNTTAIELINKDNFKSANAELDAYVAAVETAINAVEAYLRLVPSAKDENGYLIEKTGEYALTAEQADIYNKACAYYASIVTIKYVYEQREAYETLGSTGVAEGTHKAYIVVDAETTTYLSNDIWAACEDMIDAIDTAAKAYEATEVNTGVQDNEVIEAYEAVLEEYFIPEDQRVPANEDDTATPEW